MGPHIHGCSQNSDANIPLSQVSTPSVKLQLERKSATAITMVKPDAIISALAGTYQLLNITIFRAGVPVPVDPYGTKGLLIYTRTGYVTAILTSWARSDLPDNGNNMT